MRKVAIKRATLNTLGASSPSPQQSATEALLRARGLDTAPEYSLAQLHPPSLRNIDLATGRLCQAIQQQQRILVVGDFDADGATATVLAVSALRAFGAKFVDWKIPDRFSHGYGLSERLVSELLKQSPDILLTVDQGVSSIAGVALAKAAGIDVIITDHHLPGSSLPDADAIINPNLVGDNFPSKHLSGVGVVFYLMVALRTHLREAGHFQTLPEPKLDQWLDLVAIGTVADLVSLDSNNRVMVSQGLSRIQHGITRPGVRALLEIAGRNLRHVTAADLGFAVAPRLNAAGRLDDMGLGVRCLLTDSQTEAVRLARELDTINQNRKALQETMQAQAHAKVKELMSSMGSELAGACLFNPEWHQGVVGLVAGQLAELIRRPVIVFAPDENETGLLKGSARSPSGIHMRDLLVSLDVSSPNTIERFGGHSGAAGLTIRAERLVDFQTAFDRLVANIPRNPEYVLSDGVLTPELICPEFAQHLQSIGPWGQGFSEPLFDGSFHIMERRSVGGDHLKLRLCPTGSKIAFDAIAFKAGPLCHQELPEPWHVTYRLEVNRWRGRVQVQLNLQHWVTGVLDSA